MDRRIPIALLGLLLPAQAADRALRMTTVSNRPDMISGGDALVRIDLPGSVSPADVTVRRDGTDVSASFRPGPIDHTLLGLVTGLKPGPNLLEAFRAGESTPAADLAVTNHPIAGPVFSGPQEQPFICQTEEFKLPDGSFLGPPLDADCSVGTVVTYVYRSTKDAKLKVLPSTDALPDDVAFTTTSLGRRVPYVVRIETGTINRAIYQFALLHDPIAEPDLSPLRPSGAWNRRLLYTFGGGCTTGWYRQGATLGFPAGIVTDAIVGKGYAYAGASLNVFGNNCQDITAAETMMMVKERFIETAGVPLFTFGRGGSGGSYQQIQIAGNYPGLLDGIIPSATFPDVLATIQFLTDIQLLDRYYNAGDALTPEQQRAVAGVGVLKTVSQTAPSARRIHAAGYCPAELPQALRYDPVSNRTGARCDVFDHTVNAYGRDPETGFARRPLDNTGVEYGLAALVAGAITPAQFIDLNEKIGGYDNDGNMVPTRSVADPRALRAAYDTGRLTSGGMGLANVPIIDSRSYVDLTPAGNLHLKYHSFSFRERLIRANGSAANEVLLVVGEKAPPGFEAYTIAKMDEWLTTLANDRSTDPMPIKIARARPADLVDACYTASGQRILKPQTFAGGECNKLYPTFPAPRMIAGGPVTNDVLKCQLKPVNFADYPVSFTDEEKSRLQAVFREGVCDWSKPGIEQRQPTATWLSYGR